MVDILIPAVRSHLLPSLERNIISTTPGAVIHILEGDGTYAEKINSLVRECRSEYIFTGADDLSFNEGWLERGLAKLTGSRQVVGVNTHNKHVAHFLIRREYLLHRGLTYEDIPGKVFHEYGHYYCNRELIDVARKRKIYRFAPRCVVIHNHWTNGGTMDRFYAKAISHARADRELYMERRNLVSLI